MTTFNITEQDRIDAENFLTTYLQNKVPDGDFGKGSALRDLAINSVASTFAYLRKEVDNIRRSQSLLLLAEESGTDVDDAVDEIMSNFFLTRKTGRKSRGVATLYFSEATAVTIYTSTAFYKTAKLAFVPDSSIDLAYSAAQMTPATDSTGLVTEYSIRVPLVSTDVGAQYDIEAGTFVNYSVRSPYITRVENEYDFSGGASTETTKEMLDRAPTAITVRDLNSARAIDALLKEEFPEVDDVKVVGYGDQEMVRDLISEVVTNIRMHTGGFTDIYLRGPITASEEFSGEIGGIFTDPRPKYYSFRDNTIASFSGAGIVPGDVLRVYNYLESEPDEYVIDSADEYYVTVPLRSPFPKGLPLVEEQWDDGKVGPAHVTTATRLSSAGHTFTADDADKYVHIYDSANNNGTWKIVSVGGVAPNTYAELQDANGASPTLINETAVTWRLQTRVVEYSIGNNHPNFNNKAGRAYSGRFTKEIGRSGRVLLPAKPIYYIREVSIDDATDPDLSVDGKITFPMRVNKDVLTQPKEFPGDPAYNPAYLKYRPWSHNPNESQSGYQVMELQVNWTSPTGQETRFDGKTLNVKYDTLTGYDAIWAFVVSEDRRISCASVIPRGLHPVYLSMNIRYSISKIATESLDEAAASAALASYINNFDTRLDFDVSDVSGFLRGTYDVIGYLEPVTIFYDLLSPDGRVISYQTDDELIVDPSKYVPGYLLEDQLDDPLVYGVSEDTLRYLSLAELITFEAI